MPVRVFRLARQYESDVGAVAGFGLGRMGDDDPDAAAELQIVDEEGDSHPAFSAGSPPSGRAIAGLDSRKSRRARRTASSAARPRSKARSAERSAVPTVAIALSSAIRGP